VRDEPLLAEADEALAIDEPSGTSHLR
jgi:hypothetical protein